MMNNERAERMMSMLGDEWDTVVLLGTRYNADIGGTEVLRYIVGNAYANQAIMEETLNNMLGGFVPMEECDERYDDDERDDCYPE